jgi:arsenate reductase
MVKTKILFLCTGNTARSQMAEALLRKCAGDRFDVRSAGLEPGVLHPYNRQVMAEIGIETPGASMPRVWINSWAKSTLTT